MKLRALLALGCTAMLLSLQVQGQSTAKPSPTPGDRTLTTPTPPPPTTPPPKRVREKPLPERDANRLRAKQREPAPEDPRPEDPAPDEITPPPEVRTPGEVGAAQRATTTAARLAREVLVASTDTVQAEEQRVWLAGQGAQLLRRRTLPNLGWVLSLYRLKPEASLPAVLRELGTRWPDALPEPNQRFLSLAEAGAAAPREYARSLITWPEDCKRRPRIVLLDGPVNRELPALRDRRITIQALAPVEESPDYEHGTALSALLLGADSPRGLLPDAELFVGVIMASGEDGPFTTTERVLHGLDWALGLKPSASVLNLSFGGPRSAQIEKALTLVAGRMAVAAAAGNEGRRGIAFPASHEQVIAVTAVDARGRRWARANTGEELSLGAPGVEVWTSDGRGEGRYFNGTSVATVFVTAALAVTAHRPKHEWLGQHTREAGAPGQDPEFGYGLLTLGGACERTTS
jgi:Subtilase family